MAEERRKIVHYVEDADLDDPYQHAAWALTQWPAYGDMAEMPMPVPLTPHMSSTLCALGFRYHPELAVLHKVHDANTGRGRFVDQAEWEEMQASGGGDAKVGQANQEAMDLLAKLKPDFAERLESMSADERDQEMVRMEKDAVKALNDLAALRSQLKVKDS